MKLLSLNVGLSRDVPWRGRHVRTAIFKSPVGGRTRVARLNVHGDGQADRVAHGGEHRAVYVYDRSAHEHWSQLLDRNDLAPGHFGEHLTVEGMPDDEVCVGDRYRVGDAISVVAGVVHYEPEPLDDLGPGPLLLCCARPGGPVTLDL